MGNLARNPRDSKKKINEPAYPETYACVWFLVDVQAVCADRWTIALQIFTQSTPPSI